MLIHSNDVYSIGVDPNIHGAIQFTPGFLSYMVQVPVFLLARVGAGATPYNEQRFGIGAGIGGNYSYFRTPDANLNEIELGFFAPAAVAEISFKSGGGATYILRAHMNLTSPETNIQQDNPQSPQYNMGNFGIGLIYGF